MIEVNSDYFLRKPEPDDLEYLYIQKNDSNNMFYLGGFHSGLSKNDILNWILKNQTHVTDFVWVIQDRESSQCIGHVGFYKIDTRIQCAEFAILIGNPLFHGKGIGTLVTKRLLNFGFDDLNFFRISLEVLSYNKRAISLYNKLGFKHEGTLRCAQLKNGKREDIILMSILRDDWLNND